MQNKILVLGTNSGQLDLIKHMKKIGWYVIGCSNRPNEVGASYVDEFHKIDITNISEIIRIAKETKVDIVYSVSSDTAIKSVVKASTELRLPTFYSNELISLLDNKQELRDFLNTAGLSYVPFVEISDINDRVDWDIYPCIVKPSNAQGQRGVKKVLNKEELKEALVEAKDYSSNNTAIIEDYLDGVELSCNVLVANGEIVFDVLSERLTYGEDFFGIPQGHLIPCVNINNQQRDEAVELVHQIVNSLKIENGPLYFQMKATSKGIKVIEIAPRLDGCHMWRLINHATSRNFLAETVATLLNENVNLEHVELKDAKYYELIFQHSKPDSTFQRENFPKRPNALYHEYRYNDGEDINTINGRKEVVGYYIDNFIKTKWKEV